MADEETLSRVANIVDGHEWSRFGGSLGEQIAEKLDEAGLLVGDSALRARIEALADEYEQKAGLGSEAWRVFGPQTVSVPFMVSTLRAALASPAVDATPEPTPADEPQAEAGARLVWWRLVEAMTTALGCDVQAWRDHETGEWSATCATCGCDVDEDGCANAQRLATAADQALRPAPVADDAAEPPAEDGA